MASSQARARGLTRPRTMQPFKTSGRLEALAYLISAPESATTKCIILRTSAIHMLFSINQAVLLLLATLAKGAPSLTAAPPARLEERNDHTNVGYYQNSVSTLNTFSCDQRSFVTKNSNGFACAPFGAKLFGIGTTTCLNDDTMVVTPTQSSVCSAQSSICVTVYEYEYLGDRVVEEPRHTLVSCYSDRLTAWCTGALLAGVSPTWQKRPYLVSITNPYTPFP